MQITQGQYTYTWAEDNISKLMVAYMINGELTINIDDEKLTIVTNGDRMLVSVSDSFRNTTSGLCGDNSGDSKFDLLTPSGCLMRDNTLFGATWAMVNDNQCDPEVKKLHELANAVPTGCHEQVTPSVQPPNMGNGGGDHTGSSHEHQENPNNPEKKGDAQKQIRKSTTFCQVLSAVQAYEDNGEICITDRPIPACSNKCEEGNLYEMTVSTKDKSFTKNPRQCVN